VNKTINKKRVESKHSLTATQYSVGVLRLFWMVKTTVQAYLNCAEVYF